MIGIKDMAMPSCCAECNLTGSFNWEHYCDITLDFIDLDSDTRPDNCPLVKIEERKVGKWIDYWGDKTEPDGETWWSGCKCSICGIFIKSHYNYCPNCGAEMRGSEE